MSTQPKFEFLSPISVMLQIVAAIVAKQTKNEGRTWPDWRTASPGKAIEHVRSDDVAA